MEKINPPAASKRIVAYVGNIVLFIVYIFAFAFALGLIVGFVEAVVHTKFDNTINDDMAAIALILTIIVSAIFRKKIFFHVITEDPPAQISQPENPQN